MPDPSFTFAVAGSGESVACLPADVTDLVSAVRPADDTQSLTFNAQPSGNTFTLSFNGQTTAPITATPVPPIARIEHTASGLTPGTAYRFWWHWGPWATWNSSAYTAGAILQIVDGVTGSILAATSAINQQNAPTADVTDGVAFQQVAASVTPSGTTLIARVIGPPGASDYSHDQLLGGVIRFAPVASLSTATILPGENATVIGVAFADNGRYLIVGSSPLKEWVSTSGGSGIVPVGTAVASDIQTALRALSSVAPIGLVVAGSGVGPFTVTFQRTMGNTAQPNLTASSGALTITHTFTGGQAPVLTNATQGWSAPLAAPYWGATAPAYLPFLQYNLPPRYPAEVKTVATGINDDYTQTGSGWSSSLNGNQFSAYTNPEGSWFYLFTLSATDTATFYFYNLPPGTYRVAAHWRNQVDLTTAAQYAVSLGDTSAGTAETPVISTINQTVAPADFTADGIGWKVARAGIVATAPVSSITVVVSNPTAGNYLMADCMRLERTSADTSRVVNPGDVCTLTAPAGAWTVKRADNSIFTLPAFNAVAVDNRAGSEIGAAFDGTTPRTMKIGYNYQGESVHAPMGYSSDAKHRIAGPLGSVFDSRGYPTQLPGPSIHDITVSTVSTVDQTAGRNGPSLPAGTWVLQYPGQSEMQLTASGSSTTDVNHVSATHLTSGPKAGWLRRTYSVVEHWAEAPTVGLYIAGSSPVDSAAPNGPWNCDCPDFNVYPPGVDPDNPGEFHPGLMAKATGQVARFVDALSVITGNVRDFTDYTPVNSLSWCAPVRTVGAAVVSIGPYTGTDRFVDKVNRLAVLVTTATPHGLADGEIPAGFFDTNGGAEHYYLGSVNLSGGGTTTLQGDCYQVKSISTTSFICEFTYTKYLGVTAVGTITNTLNFAGSITIQSHRGSGLGTAGGLPLPFIVDFCNAKDFDVWFNLSMIATDACVTAVGAYLAANLKPTLKVHFILGNEIWNDGSFCLYQAQAFARSAGHDTGGPGDFAWYQVHRSVECWTLLEAAFVAAGRPSSDVIRTLECQIVATMNTVDVLNQAQAQGITFHELSPAPYWGNEPSEPHKKIEGGLADVIDPMTDGQRLDLEVLMTNYAYFEDFIVPFRSALDSRGFTGVRIFCYEGGPQGMQPPGARAIVRPSRTGLPRRPIYRMSRHPRYRLDYLARCQRLQNSGVTGFLDYMFAGPGQAPWAAWTGSDQLPLSDTPSDNAGNLQTPLSPMTTRSVYGRAVNDWAALVSGSGGGGGSSSGSFRASHRVRGLRRMVRSS